MVQYDTILSDWNGINLEVINQVKLPLLITGNDYSHVQHRLPVLFRIVIP